MSNIWLDLKNENNLYRNLILLKSYVLSNGHINQSNECERKVIKDSIKELLADKFDEDFFNNNIQFLLSQKIIGSINYTSLTTYGIQYVENLIDELSKLDNDEIEIIKKSNTEKIVKFLDISSKFATTGNTIINLINLLNK